MGYGKNFAKIALNILFVAFIQAVFWGAVFNKSHAQAMCFSDPQKAYEFLLNAPKPPININTASAGELIKLDGIGVKTAENIVLYRQTVGRFHHIDDLTKVKGIGQKTLDKNRHRLTVQNP